MRRPRRIRRRKTWTQIGSQRIPSFRLFSHFCYFVTSPRRNVDEHRARERTKMERREKSKENKYYMSIFAKVFLFLSPSTSSPPSCFYFHSSLRRVFFSSIFSCWIPLWFHCALVIESNRRKHETLLLREYSSLASGCCLRVCELNVFR